MQQRDFELVSPFQPAGDQPQAIEKLIHGIQSGQSHQTLMGVTGSGKTFTIANVIQTLQRPALVLAPPPLQLHGGDDVEREQGREPPAHAICAFLLDEHAPE